MKPSRRSIGHAVALRFHVAHIVDSRLMYLRVFLPTQDGSLVFTRAPNCLVLLFVLLHPLFANKATTIRASGQRVCFECGRLGIGISFRIDGNWYAGPNQRKIVLRRAALNAARQEKLRNREKASPARARTRY